MSAGGINLLTSSWIAIRSADGEVSNATANEIANPKWRDLVAPRADFRGALYQFFIGLLQTTFAPADLEEWRLRWSNPPGADELSKAFAPYQHAFQLENPAGPAFMQDLKLPDTANQL